MAFQIYSLSWQIYKPKLIVTGKIHIYVCTHTVPSHLFHFTEKDKKNSIKLWVMNAYSNKKKKINNWQFKPYQIPTYFDLNNDH